MFTGIVVAKGVITSSESFDGDLRIRFEAPRDLMQGSGVGDSISVSGVCLTMLDPDAQGFSADVSVETLDKTSLGARGPGDSVNLELAMEKWPEISFHATREH